jgi:hypothetical protein
VKIQVFCGTVSASCVTIPKPDSLSSSGTGLHCEIKKIKIKSAYLHEQNVRKPLVESNLQRRGQLRR